MNRSAPARLLAIALLATVAGCAKHRPAPAPAPSPAPPPPVARPLPPNGAPEKLVLPAHDEAGGYRTINAKLGDAEAVWHVRSALNVAALSCDRSGRLGLAADYNALLDRQKAVFAAAYRAEAGAHGGGDALDRHITQIYNFFAQPPAQPGFCTAALAVSAEARTIAPEGFTAFAVPALAQLETPFTDFYRAYERYRIDLAAWEASGHAAEPAAPAARLAAITAPAGPALRIQLGAYTGDKAAHDAWIKIGKRLDKVAGFEPRYEPVPGKPLVRVQIGPIAPAQAIELCAAAAAANLDCRPVPIR